MNERNTESPAGYTSVSRYAHVRGVTPARAYQEIQAGRIDAVKIAGRYMIPSQSLRRRAAALARQAATLRRLARESEICAA